MNGIATRCIAAGIGAFGGAWAQALGSGSIVAGGALGGGLAAAAAPALRRHTRDLGDGIVHGLALAWFAWLALALLESGGLAAACATHGVRARLPALFGWLLGFGVPFGIWLGSRGRAALAPGASRVRACVVGGGAGALIAAFAPTLVEHALPDSSTLLRSLGAIALGIGYGLLFQRGLRGFGSSFGHGIAFGVLVWVLGPLTVVPWLGGQPLRWSAAAVSMHYGAFVAHVVFGLVLGMVHAACDRLWLGFFVASDPLRRDREGLGGRALHTLGRGALAGLAGGCVFAPLMWDRGMLPYVAQAFGGGSEVFGLGMHLLASVAFGAVYGVLFRAQVVDAVTALGAGLVFGLVAWFLGQLTLFPLQLGEALDWSLPAAAAALPSLLGHLLYGATTASVFRWLDARGTGERGLDPRWLPRVERLDPARAAPLWLFVLGISLLLPIALG